MELLEGTCLRELVDSNLPPLPVPRTCDIGANVAAALAHAHARKLVHRDIKPENIFLDSSRGNERVVVVDFGLAFIEDDRNLGRMTREGVVTGTPDYLSPEQARGITIGTALGRLLARLCSLRNAHQCASIYGGDNGRDCTAYVHGATTFS